MTARMMNFLPGGFQTLQLDIVGFLAILGEASVLANAQVSTNSPFFLLPRLLPAPQALIRSSRPERLVPTIGKVVGARSGGIRDHVNHIAHLLHDGDQLAEYSVRCEKITKPKTQPLVKAKLLSPLTLLSILGCAMSITIFVLAIVKQDGMALLADVTLSFLSTLIGIGSRWNLLLKERESKRLVPPGDVVIKYPQGAFLIIKCDEDIARELYWHPEKCIYEVGTTSYRLISLVTTLMLMFGVIFLANAQLFLQLFFAGAYVILNIAYWIVAALPQRWHWDLSRYQVTEQTYEGGELNTTFTEALWRAIAITQTVQWVRIGDVAPVSAAWDEWLAKADEMVIEHGEGRVNEKTGAIILPAWDFQQALSDFLNPDPAARNV